jgi:hypothetical protein
MSDDWDFDPIALVKQHRQQAWGQTKIHTLDDFSPISVLQRCRPEHADITVEFNLPDAKDAIRYTDDHSIPPVSRLPEVGPSDTNTPIQHLYGDDSPPGMFGSAIKSVTTIMALAGQTGEDTSKLESFFKSSWGIGESVDLKPYVPNVRSKGPAAWGGIGSNLSSTSHANPSVVKHIKVHSAGLERKTFGENALVDWPRLFALATSRVARLLIEDPATKTFGNKIYFHVDRKQIATAPNKCHLEWLPTVEATKTPNNEIMRSIADYHSRYVAAEEKPTVNTIVNIETESTIITPMDAMMAREDKSVNPLVDMSVMVPGVLEYEPDVSRGESKGELPKSKKISIEENYNDLLVSYAFAKSHVAPRVEELRDMAREYDLGRITDVRKRAVHGVLNDFFSGNFWAILSGIQGRAIHDMRRGREQVLKFFIKRNAPDAVTSATGWSGVFKLAMGSKYFVTTCLSEIANAVGGIRAVYSTEGFHVPDEAKLLTECKDLGEYYDKMMKGKIRYWQRYYLSRAQALVNERKEGAGLLQMKAKFIGAAIFTVRANGHITHEFNPVATREYVKHAFERYTRKRPSQYKEQDIIDGMAAISEQQTTPEICRQFDIRVAVHSEGTMSKSMNEAEIALGEMANDLSKLHQSIVDVALKRSEYRNDNYAPDDGKDVKELEEPWSYSESKEEKRTQAAAALPPDDGDDDLMALAMANVGAVKGLAAMFAAAPSGRTTSTIDTRFELEEKFGESINPLALQAVLAKYGESTDADNYHQIFSDYDSHITAQFMAEEEETADISRAQ